jgi:benzil reductase ((S)-benzoin forming)
MLARVVVTGAGRGIGRALALELVARGAEVVALVREPGAAPQGCVEVVGDLRDAETPRQLFDVAASRGPIDAWVNNAGVLTPIERLDQASIDDVIDALSVNVLAVVRCSALFAGHVAQRDGGGVLVNISSGAASSVHEGWTRVLDVEGEQTGLRALSIAPGVVDTGMQAQIRATPIESFPSRQRFDELYAQGGLRDPAAVAVELADLLVDPGDGPVVRRL